MSKYSSVKRGWRVIGGEWIYCRSKAEANFAHYLEWQKKKGIIKLWLHEPRTFWFPGVKRGCVSYLPDFQVIDNHDNTWWYEVKGYMDAKSKTKIKRFAKYFPDETLFVMDSKWFRKYSKKMKLMVPNWE